LGRVGAIDTVTLSPVAGTSYRLKGHMWNEVGEELVDFSAHAWEGMQTTQAWSHAPPSPVWGPRDLLVGPWQQAPARPKTGEPWYRADAEFRLPDLVPIEERLQREVMLRLRTLPIHNR
jgi:hypothetical protein